MTLEIDASPASPGRSLDLRVSAKPFTATRDGFSPTRGSGRSPPTGQLTSPRHASRCRCPTGRRSRKPIAALSPDSRYRRPGEIRGFGVTIRLDNRNERCDDSGTAKSAVEFIDSVMKVPSKDLRIVDFSALVGFDEPLQMVDRYLHRLDVGFFGLTVSNGAMIDSLEVVTRDSKRLFIATLVQDRASPSTSIAVRLTRPCRWTRWSTPPARETRSQPAFSASARTRATSRPDSSATPGRRPTQ